MPKVNDFQYSIVNDYDTLFIGPLSTKNIRSKQFPTIPQSRLDCRVGGTFKGDTNLSLQPVINWQSLHRVSQHRIDIRIHPVCQIGRRVFQQPLCHGSGNTVLGKQRAKCFPQVMEL